MTQRIKNIVHRKGFTLIELLVVTAIIGIMSAILFPDYNDIKGNLLLDRTANKLSQDIRNAGEMAMSAKLLEREVPPGYGIYMETGKTYYILYADTVPLDGNFKYDDATENIQVIELEKGVKILSVTPEKTSINFSPPLPRIKIYSFGNPSELSEVTIVISLAINPARTRTIRVNAAGLVDVN
ncbi:MAG: type II secretion system protein [bacterium]